MVFVYICSGVAVHSGRGVGGSNPLTPTTKQNHTNLINNNKFKIDIAFADLESPVIVALCPSVPNMCQKCAYRLANSIKSIVDLTTAFRAYIERATLDLADV